LERARDALLAAIEAMAAVGDGPRHQELSDRAAGVALDCSRAASARGMLVAADAMRRVAHVIATNPPRSSREAARLYAAVAAADAPDALSLVPALLAL
jgi:pilus assembly protein TadC